MNPDDRTMCCKRSIVPLSQINRCLEAFFGEFFAGAVSFDESGYFGNGAANISVDGLAYFLKTVLKRLLPHTTVHISSIADDAYVDLRITHAENVKVDEDTVTELEHIAKSSGFSVKITDGLIVATMDKCVIRVINMYAVAPEVLYSIFKNIFFA